MRPRRAWRHRSRRGPKTWPAQPGWPSRCSSLRRPALSVGTRTVVASEAGATVIWSDLYASASAYGQGRWRRAERLMLSASTAWQARGWSVAALVGVAESVAVEASEWLGRGSGCGDERYSLVPSPYSHKSTPTQAPRERRAPPSVKRKRRAKVSAARREVVGEPSRARGT